MAREDATSLTENKRRAITVLKKFGPLSKGEVAEKCSIGWSTAVKVIGQLQQAGIVEKLGTERQDHGRRGKRAYLHALTKTTPLAVGVDVEYRTTSMVVTNLLGETLGSFVIPTVSPKTARDLRNFLLANIPKLVAKKADWDRVCGIGIGIPGIGFASASRLDNIKKMQDLEAWLSERFKLPVSVSDNTKAYAVFEQWTNQTFPFEDFIFLSIRTGIGTGIFHHGNLYLGNHGLAGEIGHIPVVPDGRACRCGNRGCMETYVGQRSLFRSYCEEILRSPEKAEDPDPAALKEGLIDLFSRAHKGEKAAASIIRAAADYLGRCLAVTITVLDIPNVVVSGHFGDDGEVLLEPLRETVKKNLLPGLDFNVKYLPFDPQGHVQGAALLVLKDYFINPRLA